MATAPLDSEEIVGNQEDSTIFAAFKRVREFAVQTEVTKNIADSYAQTELAGHEDAGTPERRAKHRSRRVSAKELALEKKSSLPKTAFSNKEALKRVVTQQAIKPPYNVFDHYRTEGWAQRVARKFLFEQVTLFVVLLNTIWLAIDADYNSASVLVDAAPVFQAVENLFCLYFSGELLVRFLAFKRKRNACKDYWFVFDSFLLTLMIVETWLISIIIVAAGAKAALPGGTSLLRVVRLVKLLRLTRMSKLLRAAPELVIIMKGLVYASRSVCVFFLLWVMIVYVFAILFKQITDGQVVGITYFHSVPAAMNTLLLNGVFCGSLRAHQFPFEWI